MLRITLILFLFLETSLSQGQQLPKVEFPSPSAMQIQKYGDYTVGNFTGVPDISIPIYTVKNGDIEFPITLRYHASGIKPTDHNGIVGVGWSLNTGLINRTVFNKPDESKVWPTTTPFPSVDFLDNYSSTHPNYPGWFQADKAMYLEDILQFKETDPDVFSISCLDKSGKFIFRNGNPDSIMFLDYKPYKVKVYKTASGIDSIALTDEFGRRYMFSARESSSTVSNGLTWKLTSIRSPIDTLNKLRISYILGGDEQYDRVVDTYTEDDSPNEPGVYRDCWGVVPMEDFFEFLNEPTYAREVSVNNIYQTHVPQTIYFSSGRVEFSYDVIHHTLTSIKIFNLQNQPLRTFTFEYKIPDTEGGTYCKRVFLKKISFKDSDSVEVFKYEMNYLNEDDRLTRNQYFHTDYWGYYNDGPYGDNMIPPFSIIGYELNTNYVRNIGDGNRISNEQTMKYYTLKEIKHPTGGKTAFDFEANRYNGTGIMNYTSNIVGGLRIRSITNFDSTGGIEQKKEYKYGISSGDEGYGLMDILPSAEHFSYSETIQLVNCESGNEYCRRIQATSDPLVDLAPHGSPVIYPIVSEISTDGNEATPKSFKTVYQYDYVPESYEFLTGNLSNGNPRFTTHEGLYKLYKKYQSANYDGKLISEINYDSVGNVLEGKTYNYEEVFLDTIQGFHLEVVGSFMPDPCCTAFPAPPSPERESFHNGMSPWHYGDIFFQSSHKRLQSIVKYIRGNDSSSFLEQETRYYYSNSIPSLLVKQTEGRSDGDTSIQLFKYPVDFKSTPIYAEMADNRNMLFYVVEEKLYLNDTSKHLKSQRTTYSQFNGAVIMPQIVEEKTANDPYLIKTRFHRYDQQANLLEFSKENDVRIGYIWGYNNTLPIAEFVNAPGDVFAHTSFEYGSNGGWTITDTSRYYSSVRSGERANLFAPGASISKSGLPTGTSYILSYWSKNGSLVVNGNIGSSGLVVNGWTFWTHVLSNTTTSVNVSGNGKIIDDLSLYPVGAQFKSYTYKPLYGLSSATDICGKIVYYEYDTFGRLFLVRDENKNVLQRICYNYAGQPEDCRVYYNVQKSQSFTKNCGTGFTPPPYLYIVPANRYAALTQSAADSLAQVDINLNGQHWADSLSTCPTVYYSAAINQNFYKSNCPSGYTASAYPVTVAYGYSTSTISQVYVDSVAQTYAQSQANSNGLCTPPPGSNIYGRLEVTNEYIDHHSSTGAGGVDYYFSDATYVLKFYTDSACTTPFILTDTLQASFDNYYVYHTVSGGFLSDGFVDYGQNVQILPVVNQYTIGNATIFYKNVEFGWTFPYDIEYESLESNTFLISDITGFVLVPVPLLGTSGSHPNFYFQNN